MASRNPFNSLLLPTDFSDAAREAFQWSLQSVDGEDPSVIVLHVLDDGLIDTIASYEVAPREEVAKRMRQYAEQQLAEFKKAAPEGIEVDTVVAEGVPFLVIDRMGEDFAVDGIVMGRVGMGTGVEKLLFGSTAEKVLRGARRPVIVLPAPNRS